MLLPNESGPIEWRRGDFVLSTDRERLDVDWVHRMLSEKAYWAQGSDRAKVERSIAGAMILGVYRDDVQVGFGRVVTDFSRLAYLLDVFIDEDCRGLGLGTWIAGVIRTHPDLSTVTRWLLTTADAHEVYRRAGWQALEHPEWLMEVPRGAAAKTTSDDRQSEGID